MHFLFKKVNACHLTVFILLFIGGYSIGFNTAIYGGNGGTINTNYGLYGKITGILKWGNTNEYNKHYSDMILINEYITDDSRDTSSLGWGNIGDINCPGFILNEHDFIDGYRIYFGTKKHEFVNGIEFHTYYNLTYSCVPHFGDDNTGWIIYKHHYLSGFLGRFGLIIDSIGFRFNPINDFTNKAQCIYKDAPHLLSP